MEASRESKADKTAGYTRDPPMPQKVMGEVPVKADTSMLWAAATLCFFGFLWTGEAVAPPDSGFDARYHLSYGDMCVNSIQNPLWMEAHIKQSKCNQFAEGIKIVIGATGSHLCPVAAMLGLLVQMGCAPGALFLFKDGCLLTHEFCLGTSFGSGGIRH